MKKISAIFKIIFSDNFAVFTWKDAPDSDEYLTAPYFTWDANNMMTTFLIT